MDLSVLQVARFVAWSLATAVVVFSLVPPDLRLETGVSHIPEHFFAYASTGAAFAIGYRRSPAVLAMLFLAFAGVVELAQLFAPGRHARVSDFVVDALSMYAALLAVSVTKRIRTGLNTG